MLGQRTTTQRYKPPLSQAQRERIVRLVFEFGSPVLLVFVVKDVFF